MAAACASPARPRTSSCGSSACAAATWPPRETTRAARQPFLAALPSAVLREKYNRLRAAALQRPASPRKPSVLRRIPPVHQLETAMLFVHGVCAVRCRATAKQLASRTQCTAATRRTADEDEEASCLDHILHPQLPAYPSFVAGEAVRSQLSPDGTTLAILCAGQNSLDDAAGNLDVANSTQYIFLYDVSGAHKQAPVLTQVIQQTNSHVGLVFSPDGKLYAAGGKGDAVYVYTKTANTWSRTATISLGHAGKGVGVGVGPNASGLGISADGATLVVANNYNDSISVIDTASGAVRYEHDLRPWFANNEGMSGGVGGSFPFAVVVKGNGTAYVSSDRDREVVVIDISSASAGRLVKRIKLDGNALGMTLDAQGSKLFVAEDNADQVAVIDTASNAVVARSEERR